MKKKNCKKTLTLLCLLLALSLACVSPTFSVSGQEALASPTADSESVSKKGEKQTAGKWIRKGKYLKYRYSSNTYARPGFQKIGKAWYYFNSKGYVVTGWINTKGNKYYGSTSTVPGKCGRLLTGWQTIGKKRYHFSTGSKAGAYGKMDKGWKTIARKTYYFGTNGVRRTGWLTINKKHYYLDKAGAVQTGWKKIGSRYFYFQTKGKAGVKGKMATGWLTYKGKRYYLRPTGKTGVKGSRLKSQWITVKEKRYYITAGGYVSPDVMTESKFIDTIGKLANKDMKKSGILASVTTAQAILESGYGTSSLALEGHNLFGMKAILSGNTWKSPWKGKTYKKSTKEYLNGKWYTITDTFRSYSTFAESLADHSAYLAGAKNGTKLRYKGVVGNKSYKKTVQLIKKGGYATDPQYVSKLCSIIKKYRLTRYDKMN